MTESQCARLARGPPELMTRSGPSGSMTSPPPAAGRRQSLPGWSWRRVMGAARPVEHGPTNASAPKELVRSAVTQRLNVTNQWTQVRNVWANSRRFNESSQRRKFLAFQA